MGLTVHWSLKLPRGKKAKDLITQLHERAKDLPFAKLSEVQEYEGDGDFEALRNTPEWDRLGWPLIQAQRDVRIDEEPTTRRGRAKRFSAGYSSFGVGADQLVWFDAWPGQGSESMTIGLSHTPATTTYKGRTLKVPGPRWSGRGFCKTQYASNVSVEHFLRCHLMVISLLDAAQELGMLADVSDEGGYWEKRDVPALANEVGDWNVMIAGMLGMIQGAVGADVEIEAPITERKDFEHLEFLGEQLLKNLKAKP